MSRGLKRAKAMQGGGDREGDILVLVSEVGLVDLYRIIVLSFEPVASFVCFIVIEFNVSDLH